MMEDIHQCIVCHGRFASEELLQYHVCPVKAEFVPLDDAPQPESHNFGLHRDDVVEALQDLLQSLQNGTAIPQRMKLSGERTVDDFKLLTLSITYGVLSGPTPNV